MPTLLELFDAWKADNLKTLDIGSLRKRSSVAHKWKAPFLCMLLRTLISWRLEDLLRQSYILYSMDHMLGARILLRSGIETLAVLINLNQRIDLVLSGNTSFNEFDQNIRKLVFGSKDGSTEYQMINIINILQKCDDRYPNFSALYAILSETAHPNSDGMEIGYCEFDNNEHIVHFSNRMSKLWSGSHEAMLFSCFNVYVHEFNDVWPEKFVALEEWLEMQESKLKVDDAGDL